jgi:hypothetical protein
LTGYVCPDFEHRPTFGAQLPQSAMTCHCGKVMVAVPEWGNPQVVTDIEPYRSMVTGEMVQGRRQHRDHLRAHGLVEVGNERGAPPPSTDTSWVKPALREEFNRMKFQGKA